MHLEDGSAVAVVGGGPAGAFFSYFFLDLALRLDMNVHLDIYEARDFNRPGPHGCNMCGGIVSETLVQMLAMEGINLPPTVVRRGIDSYVLHNDAGKVRIDTPLQEMRIAAVYRGNGPKGSESSEWESFDGYMLNLAREKGAQVFQRRVSEISRDNGKPCVHTKQGAAKTYDLLVGAVGVNSPGIKLFEELISGFRPPRTTRTYIAEFHLGREQIRDTLGSSMHVFLLNIPRVEFAALVPKGDYVTVCLLGHQIDKELVDAFLKHPEVRGCFPSDWSQPDSACHCSPKMNISQAALPFGDRVVMIGDCGVSRLYKDGIGAAYRTAKACALATVFEGISPEAFRKRYEPSCRKIINDNRYGKLVFFGVNLFRKYRFLQAAVINMVKKEQQMKGRERAMSMALWNSFTGSAPYSTIFRSSMKPAFFFRLIMETVCALFRGSPKTER